MNMFAVQEHPILMSPPMVRATLAGTKTQTRRVMKLQPSITPDLIVNPKWGMVAVWPGESEFDYFDCHCPYGAPGDRLWVRECIWLPPRITQKMLHDGADTWPEAFYDADIDDAQRDELREWRWKKVPSIHMPRWASRLTLEITEVRVERVRDINEEDSLAEGGWTYGNCPIHKNPQRSFRELWDSLNAKRGFGWAANPWVWVISLQRVEPSAPFSATAEGKEG